MIYIFTGHLGSGKTLSAVSMAVEDYLMRGRRVASNMTLFLEHALPSRSRATVVKLPYIPTVANLEQLGAGYEGPYDESKFGFLLLDEAGSWLNSRDWNDKDRRGMFSWVTHARKLGWDVGLIVHDIDVLDKQIRDSVCEAHVTCSRLDRVKVPYLPLSLPRMHLATARYKGPRGPIMKRWMTRGTDMFKAYDTRESVRPEVLLTDHGTIDMRANVTLLSAWHLRGRYLGKPWPWWAYVLKAVLALMCAVLRVVVLLTPPPRRSAPA